MRYPAREPRAGHGAFFHDEAARQRAWTVHLPLGLVGSRRDPQDSQRVRKRHTGPGSCPGGRAAALRAVHMTPARILVVDDEPGMLRAVERVLGHDHHVVGTRLSREALTAANFMQPELAIIDIRMPDI